MLAAHWNSMVQTICKCRGVEPEALALGLAPGFPKIWLKPAIDLHPDFEKCMPVIPPFLCIVLHLDRLYNTEYCEKKINFFPEEIMISGKTE